MITEKTTEAESSSLLPLCSIITPAYNAATFIEETIRSVQAQTYSRWEMLIVDDGSTDETFQVVERLAASDTRIRLIRHQKSKGPAGARNTALWNASGRFIAFLDSDDLWLPEKLEVQISFMLRRSVAISFTQYRRINQSGSQIGRLISVPPTLDYSTLLKNTAIVTSAVVLDREKTGPFELTKTYYDDFVLWLSLLRKGWIAYGLQQDLTRYRVVRKSVSRNKLRSAYWVWITYRTIERLSLLRATWCFSNYIWHGFRKYRAF